MLNFTKNLTQAHSVYAKFSPIVATMIPTSLLQLFLLWAGPATALGNDEKFINDILTSPPVDRCDWGYVSDGDQPKITNEVIEALIAR